MSGTISIEEACSRAQERMKEQRERFFRDRPSERAGMPVSSGTEEGSPRGIDAVLEGAQGLSEKSVERPISKEMQETILGLKSLQTLGIKLEFSSARSELERVQPRRIGATKPSVKYELVVVWDSLAAQQAVMRDAKLRQQLFDLPLMKTHKLAFRVAEAARNMKA